MGFLQRVTKAMKPVMGGNALFETMGVPPEQNTLDDLMRYNKTLFTVIRAITDEVGNLDIKLFKNEKPVESHWLLELVDNPNPLMRLTTYNLWEYTQTFMELAGEAFWYIAKGETSKTPRLVFILRPDKMSVIPDSTGKIIGYAMRKDDGTKIPFEPNEIMHFKDPNPMNLYRGFGATKAARDFAMTDDFASKWVRNAFYNNARPSALISLKGNITEKEFNELEKKWKSKYGGVKNANKVALIRGADIDYQKLSLGLDEIAIKDIKQMTRDDVMFMFRVSKPMLGILEDVNLASSKTANRAFMQRVIKPKMQRLTDTLEQYIYDEGIRVRFTNPVEEDKVELADYHSRELNVGLTINEIREELGKDPIDGGDYIYQPINLIPLGKPVAKTYGKVKKVTRKAKKVEVVNTKETSDIKPSDADIKLMHWKSMIGIRNAWLQRYGYSMDKVIEAEKKQVLAKLKGRQKDIDAILPSLTQAEEQWLISMLPVCMGLYSDIAEYAASIVGTDVTVGKAVEAHLSKRISKIFSEFDNRRIEALSKSLADGYLNNETLKQLSDRVSESYKPYAKGGYEAERLARTETKKLSNEGALDAYDQSQVVTGKEWYANPGACEFCETMNGEHIDLENNFVELGGTVNGKDGGTMAVTFESVDTADLHPNCECLLLPWSEEYEATGRFGGTDEGATSDNS